MVDPVDADHRRELDIVEAAPRALPVDQLPLVEPVERLRHRMIEAVAVRERDDLGVEHRGAADQRPQDRQQIGGGSR
jgi:hypothetical protein